MRRGPISPADLEAAVETLRGVRGEPSPSSPPPTHAEARLVVLAEFARPMRKAGAAHGRVVRAIVDRIGMPPDDVVLAPPGSVLKTSSGKVRRATSRQLYEQGALARTQHAPWRQLARLVARAVVAEGRHAAWGIVHVAWACWAGAVFSSTQIGAKG